MASPIIIDGHQDIAYNVINHGRDFRAAVAQTRAREGAAVEDIATLGLPDILAGGVGIVFGTLFVAPAGTETLAGARVYRSAQEAHDQAVAQLAVYQQLAADPRITLITDRADLTALINARQTHLEHLGIVVLMEGADPIRTPPEAAWWQTQGVRIVGPAWGQTRYSGGTRAPGPLPEAGRALMHELNRTGLALDASHMAEQSFWDALEIFEGPLIASHSNCQAIVPGDRHLTDAMINAIAARNGVIGVVLYNRFLKAGWVRSHGKNAVTLADVVQHIDHICQRTGSAQHAAIGSDLDGGLGRDSIPAELDSVADLGRIGDALADRGYTDPDIHAILGGNWLRWLERTLPE